MLTITTVYKAFRPSIAKHWGLFVMGVFFMISAVLLGALLPYNTRNLINEFTSTSPDGSHMWQIFRTLIFIYIGINICYRLFDISITMFQARVMKDLTKRSFTVLQKQSMRFFENSFTGSLITSAKRFANAFDNMSDVFFYQFIKTSVLFTVVFIVILQEKSSLAMFLIGWLIIYGALIAWGMRLQLPLYNVSANVDSEIGAVLADSISNHMTVKSFGQEKNEEQRFFTVAEKGYNARLKAWFVSNAFFAGQGILMAAAELGLIWYLITGWQAGSVTAGDFVFFQAYILWIIEQIWMLGPMTQRFFMYASDAKEMAGVYSLSPDVQDEHEAKPLEIKKGEVVFDNASFSYVDKKHTTRHTIHDMTLAIPAGQSIGFVGRSGAGKSTLVKLLLRFYDLKSGSISIDGQDIATTTQESLRQQVAVVPQDPQMFHSTILHNIAFARPSATEEEVIQAAKEAYAWDFIQELPQGLNSVVGERGIKLSGGQRQRIAIARAILADPKILILDEATSALDSATEKIIQKAIHNLLSKRTSIVIAHRLSTIMQLDRIIVIRGGEIIEDGNHAQLLEKKGEYADLWEHQSGGYLK